MERSFFPIVRAIFGDDLPAACHDCRADLAAFVDAELDGRDAVELFPAVPPHLTTCTDCREEYLDLKAMLQRERQGALPIPPTTPLFAFPFLEPAPLSWQRDRLGRLLLYLSNEAVTAWQALARQIASPRAAVRRSSPAPLWQTSLPDVFPDMKVTLEARAAADAGRCKLTVTLSTSGGPTSDNLAGYAVTIYRDTQEIDSALTDHFGEADFPDLPCQDWDGLSIAIAPPHEP